MGLCCVKMYEAVEIDINIQNTFGTVLLQAVSVETSSPGPTDSEQRSTGNESHQTENILHNAMCLS